MAKDGCGFRMSLWLSVLTLSPGSSSCRGWGEGIGVNIGRTISNHLCGSGTTDWHLGPQIVLGRWRRLLLLFLAALEGQQATFEEACVITSGYVMLAI